MERIVIGPKVERLGRSCDLLGRSEREAVRFDHGGDLVFCLRDF